MLSRYRVFIIIALSILSINNVTADKIADFRSDGCSQFPDGTLVQQNLWCDCCIEHDVAYWQGGNQKLKGQADIALRQCVLNKTDSSLLADAMYYGVTIGGLPIFPTWYRWGYGWSYGRGFQSLNKTESQQVKEKLQQYYISTAANSCDSEHPIKLMIKDELRDYFGEKSE